MRQTKILRGFATKDVRLVIATQLIAPLYAAKVSAIIDVASLGTLDRPVAQHYGARALAHRREIVEFVERGATPGPGWTRLKMAA
jgi:hypothetical protein